MSLRAVWIFLSATPENSREKVVFSRLVCGTFLHGKCLTESLCIKSK